VVEQADDLDHFKAAGHLGALNRAATNLHALQPNLAAPIPAPEDK
jgi:hypothetical protein